MTMVKVGGDWLVDDMDTNQLARCSAALTAARAGQRPHAGASAPVLRRYA